MGSSLWSNDLVTDVIAYIKFVLLEIDKGKSKVIILVDLSKSKSEFNIIN